MALIGLFGGKPQTSYAFAWFINSIKLSFDAAIANINTDLGSASSASSDALLSVNNNDSFHLINYHTKQ